MSKANKKKAKKKKAPKDITGIIYFCFLGEHPGLSIHRLPYSIGRIKKIWYKNRGCHNVQHIDLASSLEYELLLI